MTMKAPLLAVLILTFSATGLCGQDQERDIPSGVDGWLSLQNVNQESWRILDSGGEGVHSAAAITRVVLEVGGTYYFDLSAVDSERIPLAIVDATGKVLLSQKDEPDDAALDGVSPHIDEDGIRFTLTEELAEQMARFRAVPFPGMVGFVSARTFDETGTDDDAETKDRNEDEPREDEEGTN